MIEKSCAVCGCLIKDGSFFMSAISEHIQEHYCAKCTMSILDNNVYNGGD